MNIDIATLFPDMCNAYLGESILGRAVRAGHISFETHQIRDYTLDRHRRVDDTPYGGSKGMVMQCEPIYRCFEDICAKRGTRPHVIYMSPKGSVFDQRSAVRLSKMENILIICGHYEGIDQRIIDEIVDEEISVGDYVLTGGELPALIVCDAVSRMCDGVLAAEECFTDESHFNSLLEYPHYTRPPVWHDREVPSVLLTGNHSDIDSWRHGESLKITAERRPDMYSEYIRNELVK